MNLFLRYTTLLIFILGSLFTYAQESSCAFKLQEAESLYETGILDSIPGMLRSCINNNGFDEEELARAYKLLILTYQFQDYQEMAELTMLKFLKDFPEYELKPTDPVEFKYLHNSFQTIPTFSVGVIIGGNYTMTRVLEPYSQINTENYKGEYKSGINFQGGLQLKKYITEEIDINLDIIYTLRTFEYNIEQLDYNTTYTENQTIFSFPLTGTYDFKLGVWEPFARIGVSFDYLLKATADFEKSYVRVDEDPIKETDFDIIDDRNPFNISAVIGGGLKFNIKMGYVMFDLRYNYSFMNSVNGTNRYNSVKYGNFNYIDDDFSLNNLYFSLGYVYSFYRTKKND